ncbi:MAG: universal stress protein [Hyphomicrobiales bacterium]
MNKASVLVFTSGKADLAALERLCNVATKRDLHLSIVVLGRLPALPIYAAGMGGIAAIGDYGDWQQQLENTKAELDSRAQGIKLSLDKHGVACDVSVFSADPAAFSDALARRALTCDLVMVLGDLRSDTELFDDAMGAALFHSPVAVALNALSVAAPLSPKRVLIGWNSGLPASRAIRAAMPMLRGAEEVTVAMFDPVMTALRDGENPGSDVARWLSHQGCKVTVQHHPSGGKEIADSLMQRAREVDAELVVMGAYDHSRMRQIIFGGTTRSMIAQTDLPVLLAH